MAAHGSEDHQSRELQLRPQQPDLVVKCDLYHMRRVGLRLHQQALVLVADTVLHREVFHTPAWSHNSYLHTLCFSVVIFYSLYKGFIFPGSSLVHAEVGAHTVARVSASQLQR